MTILRRAALWVPPALYALAIFHLSSESDPLPTLTPLVWDKLLHTAEYAGFGVLLCRALRGEGLPWGRTVVVAMACASAYAATDEWHQLFVPRRDADVHDWIADTIGAAIGAGAYVFLIDLVYRR